MHFGLSPNGPDAPRP